MKFINDAALKTRIAFTFNKEKKALLLKEEKKIVTDDEIIAVGADIVGQLVAIFIGRLNLRSDLTSGF